VEPNTEVSAGLGTEEVSAEKGTIAADSSNSKAID